MGRSPSASEAIRNVEEKLMGKDAGLKQKDRRKRRNTREKDAEPICWERRFETIREVMKRSLVDSC